MNTVALVSTLFLTAVGSTTLTAKEPVALPEIEIIDVQRGTFAMCLDDSAAEHYRNELTGNSR